MTVGCLWECAWRELRRRRARAVTNVLGYLLAVATAVVLVSLLTFSERAVGKVLSSTGTHFVAFQPARMGADAQKLVDEENEGFVAYGLRTGLVPAALANRAKELPSVREAAPCMLFRFKDPEARQTFTVAGFDPRDTLVVGTTCCAAKDVLSGRFLWPNDRGVVILEEAYAKSRDLTAGDKLPIVGRRFPVVGVINPGIRPAKADVYMHIDDARRLVKQRFIEPSIDDKANLILVEVADARVQDEAIDAVKKLHPGLVVSSYACYRPASKVMGLNERALWLLTAAAMLCAVVWSMKSQFASVIERRREIGILKAIGWTDGNVVSLILAESVVQALLGGVAGCLVGAALAGLTPLGALGGPGAGPPLPLLLAILSLTLLGGVVAGGLPAFSAARLRPAEALRSL